MISKISHYLSQSTAHGVSNIFKYTRVSIRIMWFLLSFLAVVGFIVHSTILVKQLMEDKVTTAIIPGSRPFIQPDIIFCFYRPFSMDYINNPPPDEYHMMLNVSKKIKTVENILKSFKHVENLVYKSDYVFDTVGVRELKKAFFHRPQQLILHLSCTDKIFSKELETFFHFYSCLKITPADCELENQYSSLDALFYLHTYYPEKAHPNSIDINVMEENMNDVLPSVLKSPKHVNGVMVFFIDEKNHPSLNDMYIMAQGGTETDIRVSSTKYQHKRRKEFLCHEKLHFHEYYDVMGNEIGKHFLNFSDSKLCMERRIQLCLYEKLQCVSSILPIPISIPKNFSFCLNVTNLKTPEIELGKIFNISSKCFFASMEYCTHRYWCTYTKFELITQKMQWPEMCFLRQLLNMSFIKNEYLKAYGHENLTLPGIQEAVQDYQNTSNLLWKDNFVKIRIKKGEQRTTEIVESFAYSFERLLSDIGGILGFYLGSSILTLCEILSIFQDLICQKLDKKESKVDDAVSMI